MKKRQVKKNTTKRQVFERALKLFNSLTQEQKTEVTEKLIREMREGKKPIL